MKNVLLHNPRCSKSRKVLQLLNEHNISFDIRDYQKNSLNVGELIEVCQLLGVHPNIIIRVKESLFKEQDVAACDLEDDKFCFDMLAKYPRLLERPIFIYNNKAVVGRFPEKVLEMISS